MAEYDNSIDRDFKRQYAQHIQSFMSAEFERGMAQNTINTRVGVIKSFFKYNNLPLGYIPAPRIIVKYHNRDITHKEVKLILGASRPRERAFFTISAQSGLRPATICNLRVKHVKEDLIANHVPCKIEVPQEIAKGKYRGYFTFIGHEAVEYLKAYLHTRRRIEDDDFLFVKQGTKQQANPKSFSSLFSRTLQKLQEKELIKVEQKEISKPRDIRLYSLRKWFRKHANQAGFEYVQFWMGHIVKTGQEEHYRPTDVEHHRKLYAEKAMPFLRLETATPTETEKTIEELREQLTKRDQEINTMKKTITERDQEFKAIRETMAKVKPIVDFVNSFKPPEELKKLLEGFLLADDSMIQSSYNPKIYFEKHVVDKLDEIMKEEGITQKEAFEQLVKEDWETVKKRDERLKKLWKASGAPMTQEEYEEQKKKLSRKHMKKHSKID